jgi:hypothetical protein
MDNQLQRIIELHTEQNELLKKHLVRLKFSLMSLLVLMTITCCGLGFLMWGRYHPLIYPVPVSGPTTYVTPTPYGNLQVGPAWPSNSVPTQTNPLSQPATGSDRYGQ